jgi:hypothetical protein
MLTRTGNRLSASRTACCAGLMKRPSISNGATISPDCALPQITTGDLDIAVLRQLSPPKFSLGDEFEPGSMKMVGFQTPLGCWGLIEQGLEHAPGDTHCAFILADAHAELDGQSFGVSPGIGRKTKEHEIPPMEATKNVRVVFSNSAPKARVWSSGSSRQVDDPVGLLVLREAEICEHTGHKNAQPTHPERNIQATDLHRPSKDDPQQMHYRHDEKQRGGDRRIVVSVQSARLSASRPTTPDSSTTTSCSMLQFLGLAVRRGCWLGRRSALFSGAFG